MGCERFVSIHRAPHLRCCRALEVQKVRLRTRRLASAAPCKCLQLGGLKRIGLCNPVNGYKDLMEILPDEILDVFASLVSAEVALAEDVGFEAQQELQRVAVLAAVREQGRVEGAVDVLAIQHCLSCKDCGVDQRAG